MAKAKVIMVDKPLVSIGMPIFNAERYLSQALDSLLAQDYNHFELIISDNASTDSTSEIYKRYAAKDTRIRCYRNSENLGPTENFRKVRGFAKGKYFMWAAHDDLWDPRYISACVEVLEKYDDVILCATYARRINEKGKFDQAYYDLVDTFKVEDRIKRCRKVILGNITNTNFYGVYRLNILNLVPIVNEYGNDQMFLARLSLYGPFVVLPQAYFYSRIGGMSYSLYTAISQILDKPSYFLFLFPNIYFFKVFLRDVFQWTELSWQEKVSVMLIVCERFTFGYYGKLIRDDFKRILRNLFLEKPGSMIAKVKKLIAFNRNLKKDHKDKPKTL